MVFLSRVTGSSSRILALVGSNGMLARKVQEQAPAAGYEVVSFDLPDFDVTNRSQVLTEMKQVQPEVIINCAAYTNVDGAESEEPLAKRVNGDGPGNLAEAASRLGATLVHISTDYVFDGKRCVPYAETDTVSPVSAYGRTKLAGERAIIESGLKRYYIIRTSWLYGPNGKNFVETIIRLACEREELRVVADQIGSPTYTVDLAQAIFALLSTGSEKAQFGIYHFANEGECSWYDFAGAIVTTATQLGMPVKAQKVLPLRTDEYPLPARRPAYSVFAKGKIRQATGLTIPDWRESLIAYMKSRIA